MRCLLLVSLAFALLECVRGQAEQFQCSGTSFSPYTRQRIQEIYNQFRKQMAHGKQPNKCGLLPEGKNIYKMDYNCTLEDQLAAKISCTSTAFGVTSYMSSAPITEAQATQIIIQKYIDNWNTVVKNGANESLFPNSGAGVWSQMAYGSIGQIGCAMKLCPRTDTSTWYTLKYGCQTDMSAYSDYPPYEAGPVCKQDADCDARPHSKCLVDEGLCHYSPDYPRENVPSQFCPNGGSPLLNDAARIAALAKHNAYRSSLIHGKEPMGTDGALVPGGGNMYKMVYNCNIELKAQEWCSQITSLQHSTSAFRNYDGMPHGENLAGAFGTSQTAKIIIERSSDMWWDELREYGWKGVTNRTVTNEDFAASIGHWSQ
ncbi:CBN-VAP-1 protein, partial [Aphelenchoides avenae]